MFRFIIIFGFFSSSFCGPKVTIPFGTIHGRRVSVNGNNNECVDEYLGIPYAKPPVGNLRFAKPQPITKTYKKQFNATSYAPVCVQYTDLINHADCLYLNIWRPVDNGKNNKNPKKPVLVWIHGGGFFHSGPLTNASVLAKWSNCIVVTIQHRLNLFGFLNANTDDISGNAGLYDQNLALQWVQKNIQFFGGNKHKVTMIGWSAGAWSISLHLLSPLSTKLYKNAIIMSGVALDYLVVDTRNNSFNRAKALAKLVGCNFTEDSIALPTNVTKCLREIDSKILLNAANDDRVRLAAPLPVWPAPFLPIFGDAFLPSAPRETWKIKHFKPNTNLLIGNVFNEFILDDMMKSGNELPSNVIYKLCAQFPPEFLTNEECKQLVNIYFNGINETSERQKAIATVSEMYNDIVFHCPTVVFAESFAEFNNVSQYLFDYKSPADYPHCGPTHPCHASDIAFTFGQVRNETDFRATRIWVQAIGNFARNGKVFWPQYYRTEKKQLVPLYYEYKGSKSTTDIHVSLKKYKCLIWKSIILKDE